MSGPTINRANSSGDIWTPTVFRGAIVKRFGWPTWDLAASAKNSFSPFFWNEAEDSLSRRWHVLGKDGFCGEGVERGLLWLNPPYSNITPWARKCAEESRQGAEILLLVPASVGANWYWDHVEPYADVYSVGRMAFDNCFDKQGRLVTTQYPKDLILAHYYDEPNGHKRMQRWRWKQ